MGRNSLSFTRWIVVTCAVLGLIVLGLGRNAVAAQNSSTTPAAASTSQTLVPQLIKFSGTLTDLAGKAISGPVDVTFSLYSEESGGTPLWYESQTVNANAAGEYTTLLGAMTATGVPMDLFTSGQARWLGVAVRGLPEQSRILLVSVPYAMTSGNAEMLGGKPAADYLLASQSGTSSTTTAVVGTSSTSTTSGRTAKQATTASPQSITTGPTANYIAGWESDGSTLGASNIYQDPTTNDIGIGTTAPLASAEIAGPLSTTTPETVLDLSRNYNTGVAYLSAASFLLSNPHVGTNNSRLDIALRNANSNHDALPDTTVMSLVSNGNVGIGTTSPASQLEVASAGGANGTSIAVADQVDGTSKYGYAQEAYKLSNPAFNAGAGKVVFSFGAEGDLSNAGAVTNSDFYIFDPAGTGNYEAVFQGNGTAGGGKIALGTNITDAGTLSGAGLTIDSSGNVNVAGTLTATKFFGDGSGLTNVGGSSTVITGSTGTLSSSGSSGTFSVTNSGTGDLIDAYNASSSTTPVFSVGNGGNMTATSFNGALLNGSGNSILGTGSDNTVAGGSGNAAGASSTANSYAMVAGGSGNTASGSYSLAAGCLADAANDGAFVWSGYNGSACTLVKSAAAGQFIIFAPGNVGIDTDKPGRKLTVNGGVSATKFFGNGSGLTNLPASALSGTDSHAVNFTNTSNSFTGSFTGALSGTAANSAELGGVAPSGYILDTTSPQAANLNVTGSGTFGQSVKTTELLGGNGTQNANDTLYLGTGAMANFFLDRSATGGQIVVGYNTPKGTSSIGLLQVYNNRTDRKLLFEVQSAGSSSGANAVLVPGALSLTPDLTDATGTTTCGSTTACVSANVLGGYGAGTTATGADTITSGVVGGTIAGGGGTLAGLSKANQVTDDWGTVGGGFGNIAGNANGSVNDAIGATVSGGWGNLASGYGATVGGGYLDYAYGSYAMIPGGFNNTASGYASFAAGCEANAAKTGSFVWSGYAGTACTNVASTANGQFVAFAPGGFNLETGSGTGCSIAAGGGAWSCTSNRNAKANFAPVNESQLLASLNRIPITSWNYKTQEPSIRHLGPMAQDFYKAFRLGKSNKQIGLLDEGGVALAGVQALYRLSLAKDKKIAQLREQTIALAAQNQKLVLAGKVKKAKLAKLARQNRKLASEVAQLQKEASAVEALEARLSRDEAQNKATRTKLAHVIQKEKKNSRTELARVQF